MKQASKKAPAKSKVPVPCDEAERVAALHECAILDTEAEETFDGIARLAAYICETPIALVSLVDASRLWFKAKVGFDASELPRQSTFCTQAILKPEPFVIEDAAADKRFAKNPYVVHAPHVRFYAAVPLVTPEGHALGVLCVIDHVPRTLKDEQREALHVLARQTMTQLELRRNSNTLAELNRKLDREIAERTRAEREREEVLAREQEARAASEANEQRYRFLAESIPQQVWTAQPDGRLDYVNQRTIEYFSLADSDIVGDSWQRVIHPDDLDGCLERWRKSLSTGEVYEVEFRLRRGSDGDYRWHLARALPMRDAAGRIIRWFGTNTDIDDQKRLYRLAEEANRAKDTFLATVSHELRTPLTSMMGWAELLKLGMLDEKKQRHAIEVIESSARSQAQLIGDLLDISRIISGKLRLDVQPVELAPVIAAAMDVVHPAAEAKSIQLASRIGRGVGMVSGDPDRIQQVIWNLLANAVKFTPTGGRVEVSLKRAGAQAEIVVHDNGAGIHPDFLPHVFEHFRQADSTSTRKHGGLGLGLAIVRRLVELHGGTVAAESEGEGHGATFRIHLPLLQRQTSRKIETAKDSRGKRTARAAAPAQS
ncbi:MAG TPA: ATP-binding protein [Pyrinomonadaceae bacterium]|jgi:PAS domain S-box-containing protein|nr:ATP-binding protein [Pyrinomonadaceae bacterium]